jgi:hypothetical protein
MTCNILKSDFVEYTQEVCNRHAIPMTSFPVRNSSWDSVHYKWNTQSVSLPLNPYATALRSRPIGVILTPKEFLRTIPSVDPSEFWEFAMSEDGEQIRADLNYEIGQQVDRRMIVRLARRRTSLLHKYLESIENNPKTPYDVEEDPELLVKRYDEAKKIAASLPIADEPEDEEGLRAFVERLIDNYRQCVENARGWTLLWANDTPRPEPQAQALFWTSARFACESHNVDLTPEAETGRGPVDFKLSQGYAERVLIELKLAKSSSFWRNIENQLPTYQRATGCKCGYLVVIQYTDRDCSDDFVDKATRVAEDIARVNKLDFKAIFIDARPKASASTLDGT